MHWTAVRPIIPNDLVFHLIHFQKRHHNITKTDAIIIVRSEEIKIARLLFVVLRQSVHNDLQALNATHRVAHGALSCVALRVRQEIEQQQHFALLQRRNMRLE